MSFLKKNIYLLLFSTNLFVPSLSMALDQASVLRDLQPFLSNPKLVGEGPFTVFRFKVYDAFYYVEEDFAKTGFALRLNYVRKVLNTDLTEATMKQMRRLGASETEISHWESELGKIYPSVEPGHHITAIYQPIGATVFLHNGKTLGKISDPQFSKVFFSIWLDSKTSAPGLRAKLLGDTCPPSIISATCIK